MAAPSGAGLPRASGDEDAGLPRASGDAGAGLPRASGDEDAGVLRASGDEDAGGGSGGGAGAHALVACLGDSVLSVRIAAAWGLAELCAALRASAGTRAMAPPLLVARLADAALLATHDVDKVWGSVESVGLPRTAKTRCGMQGVECGVYLWKPQARHQKGAHWVGGGVCVCVSLAADSLCMLSQLFTLHFIPSHAHMEC